MSESNLNQERPEKQGASVDNLHPVELRAEAEEVINNLKPKERKIITRVIQEVRAESYSGPIPHPSILQGYSNVQKDLPERIVSMAEKEQQHRMQCEKMMIEGTISETKRGQNFAFIIAFLFLAGAIWLGLKGHDWLAGVLGGSTLVGLVTVFIVGKNKNKNDADDKDADFNIKS